MAWRTQPTRWLAILLAVGLGLGLAPEARAGHEDAALFYEELAQYGTWVDYGTYGPVWYPKGVSTSWRPYLDGRWVPTEGGWVFETSEPWGWATYHFGNWMPTEDYGWVWVPGSTWYPSTVAWRTSDDYVGWAPIPPPNYIPPPAYYPPGGYYPGISPLDLLTAPLWIFAQAVNFLLGFGLPYAPSYSYYNCGCLVPFTTYPLIFPRTIFLYDYYYPVYAPRAYFFFGPPFYYVARVCRVPIGHFHTIVRRLDVHQVRNVLPPRVVWERRPFVKEALPREVREGRWRVEPVKGDLPATRPARPDIIPPPRDLPKVPPITRVTPKVPETKKPMHIQPERPRGPEAGPRKPVTPGVPERLRPVEPRPPAPERLRPAVPERRGVRLPPQAVPEEREMRERLKQQRRLEQQLVPSEQQRQFRRQERELQRQEIFRSPRSPKPEAPRLKLERPQPQPRPAPEPRSGATPPKGGGRPEAPLGPLRLR